MLYMNNAYIFYTTNNQKNTTNNMKCVNMRILKFQQIIPKSIINTIALFMLLVVTLTFKCDLCNANFEDFDLTTTKVNCIPHDTKFTCNCGNRDERMVLPHLTGFAYQVEVSNCTSLLIKAKTFDEIHGLSRITIQGVNALTLEREALQFRNDVGNTAVNIAFLEVNFQLIDSHAITGNIQEISFVGGRIENIKPFGFATVKERASLLKMEHVVVHQIEPQAFKKFSVNTLEISNCIFELNVPSKAFYELEVFEAMILQYNQFKTVHTRAFSFQLVEKLSIVKNRFEATDAEWIEAYVRETVSIRDNHFGTISEISFKGIGVHRDYKSSEPLHLQFINNRLQFPLEPRPLEFNIRFVLIIQSIYYQNQFPCKNVELMQQQQEQNTFPGAATVTSLTTIQWSFFQKYSDNLYFLHSTTETTTGGIFEQNYMLLTSIIQIDCKAPVIWPYILAGVLVLLLILLIIAVVICIYCQKKRKRRKMDVVLPEPRTYKETQIVYQIENAGLLKTDF